MLPMPNYKSRGGHQKTHEFVAYCLTDTIRTAIRFAPDSLTIVRWRQNFPVDS
jgi:hypothetical protein